jgi:hypothetical protein
MIVEISLRFQHTKTAGEHSADEILGARFSVAARDADHAQRQAPPVSGSQSLIAEESIFDFDKRELGNVRTRFEAVFDDGPDGPGARGGADVAMPVEVLAAQGDEDSARFDAARIR